MKKLSKLRTLSAEDQKRVLELCSRHTYDEVVELVAKPREDGGLAFKTNRSALSRFCSEHGGISISSKVACQFLDVIEKQPLDIDDIIPHLTHLMGQTAFLLLAQQRPYEEYRRPLDTFLRLERLSREREKYLDEQEKDRRAHAQFHAMIQDLNAHSPGSPNSPNSAPITPTKPALPNQPAPARAPVEPPAKPTPPPAVALDYTLPSFKTPAAKSSPTPKPKNNSNTGRPATLHFPRASGFLSDFSPENACNLTNLTKSHITISPSQSLPCP